MSGPWRRAILPIAALACVASGQSSTPIDRDFGDGGTSDFYRIGGVLTRPGVLLRREPVDRAFALDHAGTPSRILYSSTDGRFGRGLVAASGLLYLPKTPVPKGGWPLIVWGHGTFGIADVCAPSWKGPTPRDGTYMDRWLAQGFAVVAPDYQGLGTRGVHPYLDRKAEGFSVLDAARAVLTAERGRVANRVIFAGQSQGSGAVLNATYLAPAYAPQIDLRGTIATGLVWSAPHANGQVDELSLTPDAVRITILRMMAGGLKPGSPSPESLLSANGALLRDVAAKACSRDMVPVVKQHGVTSANAFTISPEKVEAMLTPLDLPPGRLKVPVFVGTGLADRLLSARRQYRAVAALCAQGTRVEWHGYPGITHNGGSVHALNDAIPFARGVLAGKQIAGNCGATMVPGPIEAPRAGVPFND